VVSVTDIRPVQHTAEVVPIALHRRSAERRRATLETLRRLAVQLDAASELERRADRTASPALARMLRERADERRRIAGIVREHLAAEGWSTTGHGDPAP
jgi:hypothetical protein